MIINAEITGIRYTPNLGRELQTYPFSSLENALSKDAAFLLSIEGNKIAVSWWVSSKRTRSYPYARVYDTLAFPGKKATIIPIFKDEGLDGDRDFLQWDTVSLMSLLGVYVIIGYYASAVPNPNYRNKITDQRFDVNYLADQIRELLSYQSDALHWNILQVGEVGELAKKALTAYELISHRLDIRMHSTKTAERRIAQLLKGKDSFMELSRTLAEKAQLREIITRQPKEKLSGNKAPIAIRNYLGGCYYFTVDEARKEDGRVLLIEGKHTKTKRLPSLEDIKDGLLRMILFTNLQDVEVDSEKVSPSPILLLTTGSGFSQEDVEAEDFFQRLKDEARTNRFQIMLNDKFVKL